MSELGQFISSVGFPIAVAVFLLVRLEPLIRDLQKTVTTLTIVVAKMGGVDYEEVKRLAGLDDR